MSHSAENHEKKNNLEEKITYRRTKKANIGYVSQKVRRDWRNIEVFVALSICSPYSE